MTVPNLHTPRLLLRAPTLADAPAIQRHFGRWEIIRHLSDGVPWPYPEDGAETYLRQVVLAGAAAGTTMHWVLTLREEDEAIGILEYRVGDHHTDNRGFWIALEHQGKGYMTEAVTAFQDHLFFELEVDRIYVCNAINNLASRRVKQKTGAVLFDEIELAHHSGECRCERWILTREAWTQHRATC